MCVQHPSKGSGASAACSASEGAPKSKTAENASHPIRIVGPLLRRRAAGRALTESPLDIVEHHLLEIGGGAGSAQGGDLLAVDEHGRRRRLPGAGQREADIGLLGLARSVDDA